MRLEITDNNKTVLVELHTNVGVFEPSEAMKNLRGDLLKAVYRYENDVNIFKSDIKTPLRLIPLTERLPEYADFVWVKCASRSELIMAYHHSGKFQDSTTVGDREGLSVEYFDDVTHWAEIIKPEIES